MPPVRFKPAILAIEQTQTHALDRAATEIGKGGLIANNDGKRDNTYETHPEIISRNLKKTATMGTAHVLRNVSTNVTHLEIQNYMNH